MCLICKLSICMFINIYENIIIFNNGGVPIKSMILQLLRIIDYENWYQKKLRHNSFISWSDIQIILFA